jgi:hypothetical protein
VVTRLGKEFKDESPGASLYSLNAPDEDLERAALISSSDH